MTNPAAARNLAREQRNQTKEQAGKTAFAVLVKIEIGDGEVDTGSWELPAFFRKQAAFIRNRLPSGRDLEAWFRVVDATAIPAAGQQIGQHPNRSSPTSFSRPKRHPCSGLACSTAHFTAASRASRASGADGSASSAELSY